MSLLFTQRLLYILKKKTIRTSCGDATVGSICRSQPKKQKQVRCQPSSLLQRRNGKHCFEQCSTWLESREGIEVIHDNRLVDHIAILGIHIKKIALMNGQSPVTNTLPWHNASETVLHTIKHGSPNAAASGTANDNTRVNLDGPQIASQVGTKERRRILLHQHTVPSLRGHSIIKCDKWIVFRPRAQQRNLLGENPTVSWVLKSRQWCRKLGRLSIWLAQAKVLTLQPHLLPQSPCHHKRNDCQE